MAVDEAIFRLMRENNGNPTLRLYTWNPPAVSIGYFQSSDSPLIAEYLEIGYPLVRRPTGGLAVLHENEMSYSMTGVLGQDGYPPNREEAYRRAHESIKEALVDVGLEVDMYRDEELNWKDGFCSSSWFPHDIVLRGEGKIGGSAQRRSGRLLLQHGSIALLQQVDEKHLAERVGVKFEQLLRVDLRQQELTDEELSLSEKLVREKYGTWDWNYQGRFLSLKRD